MRVVVALLIFLVGFAGCAEEGEPSNPQAAPTAAPTAAVAGETAPPNGTASAQNETVASNIIAKRTGCKQLHGIFPTTSEGWDLPEGWLPGSADGFGPTVYVYPTICTEDASLWVMLGVTPPEALRDPTVDLDYWVLSAGVVNETYRETLNAAGFPMDEAMVSLTEAPSSDTWLVNSGLGSYSLQAAYTLGNPETSGQITHRAWTLDANDQPFAIRVMSLEYVDLGLGASAFTSSGDPQAPPATAGLAHRIAEASYEVRWDRHTLSQ